MRKNKETGTSCLDTAPVQTADAAQSSVTPSPNSFCLRSYSCGELTSDHVGKEVTLLGWLQFQRMDGRFMTLRDAYGTTQVTVTPSRQVRVAVVEILQRVLHINRSYNADYAESRCNALFIKYFKLMQSHHGPHVSYFPFYTIRKRQYVQRPNTK